MVCSQRTISMTRIQSASATGMATAHPRVQAYFLSVPPEERSMVWQGSLGRFSHEWLSVGVADIICSFCCYFAGHTCRVAGRLENAVVPRLGLSCNYVIPWFNDHIFYWLYWNVYQWLICIDNIQHINISIVLSWQTSRSHKVWGKHIHLGQQQLLGNLIKKYYIN